MRISDWSSDVCSSDLPFRVGRRPGRDHLEPGDMAVPACEALGMLSGDPRRGAVGPPKDDRAAHLAAGHVAGLGGGVDELVNRLPGEIEGHELAERPQSAGGGTDATPGEPVLGNRGVDDALRAEFVEHTLAALVRTFTRPTL